MNGPNQRLFSRWFTTDSPDPVPAGKIHYLKERLEEREHVWADLVQTVRSHYIDRDALRAYCETLGYPGAAATIEVLVPADKKSRSGELGEILATEFVNEELDVTVYLKRLRNKDERETALRGDDLIGVGFDDQQRLKILKGEVKSRLSLTAAILDEAESKLLQNNGRPSQHSLGFVSTYLMGVNRTLGVAVARYNLGQLQGSLSHLIVTLTKFKPAKLFPRRLAGAYPPAIQRVLVGLVIADHKKTVERIYQDLVSAEAIAQDVVL